MTTIATDFELGRLTATVGAGSKLPTRYTLAIDRLATGRDGTCYLLSVVGDVGAIKALRAAMNANVSVELGVEDVRAEDEEGTGGMVRRLLREPTAGYALALAGLGHRRSHGLFTSRLPGFLRSSDDESLWAALKRPEITTPLLRHWVGPIAQALRGQGLLVPLFGFRARSALLTATTADLDTIVTAGVVAGTLTFREFDVVSPEATRC